MKRLTLILTLGLFLTTACDGSSGQFDTDSPHTPTGIKNYSKPTQQHNEETDGFHHTDTPVAEEEPVAAE